MEDKKKRYGVMILDREKDEMVTLQTDFFQYFDDKYMIREPWDRYLEKTESGRYAMDGRELRAGELFVIDLCNQWVLTTMEYDEKTNEYFVRDLKGLSLVGKRAKFIEEY